MKIWEIISEGSDGKMPRVAVNANRGEVRFRDPGGYDRVYHLNRIMMATACSDGVSPLALDAETWSGRYNTAHPYTEIEAKMLKQAYKAVGSEMHDLNHGDLTSQEVDSVNTQSITKPFKGYKRK